jgi:hypothetical protein
VNNPQLEFTETTPYRTEEVSREQFDVLCDRHMKGEIRMISLQAPYAKDRWLWKVTYKILREPTTTSTP